MKAATATELWCVTTVTGQQLTVEFAGNGGFGPVYVPVDGWMIEVEYRHRTGRGRGVCGTCGQR